MNDGFSAITMQLLIYLQDLKITNVAKSDKNLSWGQEIIVL